MESRVRASQDQFLTLLEYMERHGDLGRTLSGAQGRIRSDQLWINLTNILNAVSGGVSKTTEKWKKTWADLKTKTKKKALDMRCNARGTGGGPPRRQSQISTFDERVLALMSASADGQSSEKLGFYRYPSSAPSQISQTIQAQEPSKPHVEALRSIPTLINISSTTSPAMPEPSIPINFSAPLASTISPSARFPTTPATPQSVTSPRRSISPRCSISPGRSISPRRSIAPRRSMRARRRRAQTPFDRAVNRFATVEMRRLELEEIRVRQEHERQLRALDVEQERNRVLRSVVNVAQAWLDYYRTI